ncbi:MAG: LysE family transporter [PVC group bacterium]
MMFRTFGLAFMIALTGAVTPGPVLVLVMGQVLAQGIGAAFLIMLGHALLESILVLGLARGMKSVLVHPALRAFFGMVGGLVLLWMGWDLLLAGGSAAVSGKTGTAVSPAKLVLAGMGVSLSNPYFTGWWVTVGSGQAAALKLKSLRDYGIFYAGHELGDLAWYLFVAVVIATGRGWLLGGAYATVLRISALIILGLGTAFFIVSLLSLQARKSRQGSPPVGEQGT